METLKRATEQFQSLYKGMTPSQRGTLIVVPLLVFGALGLLMYTSGVGGSDDFLLGGKAFTPQELEQAQEALSQSGMTDFRIDGNRIAVSRGDVDRYTATLVAHSSLPADFAQDFDKMLEKIGTFTTESHRKDMLDEGRKRRLSKILNAMDDVDAAIVDWDRPTTRRFGKEAIPAAQVSIRLKGSQPLTGEQVRSFKAFVAGALAGVGRDQVTVTDLSTGRTVGPSSVQDAELDRVLLLTEQHKSRYEAEITKALEHIPDVKIAVNVELDPIRSTVERETVLQTKPFAVQNRTEKRESQADERTVKGEPGVGSNRPVQAQQHAAATPGNQSGRKMKETLEETTNIPSVTNTERRTEGFFPKNVTVAVSIPKDYYEKVARDEGLTEGTTEDEKKKFRSDVGVIQTGVEQDIKAQVSKLIPAGTSPDNVVVQSYRRNIKEIEVSATSSYLSMAGDWFGQWGSTLGLGILAIVALRMLSKGMVPSGELAQATANAGVDSGAGRIEEDEGMVEGERSPLPATPTVRDELQTMVRDNPEMAATLLSRWIVNAK